MMSHARTRRARVYTRLLSAAVAQCRWPLLVCGVRSGRRPGPGRQCDLLAQALHQIAGELQRGPVLELLVGGRRRADGHGNWGLVVAVAGCGWTVEDRQQVLPPEVVASCSQLRRAEVLRNTLNHQ